MQSSVMASAPCLGLLVLLALASSAAAQLSSTFYDTSCPNALSTIKSAVTSAVNNEPRMGASLLRMHFHDCFVDASPCWISTVFSSAREEKQPPLLTKKKNSW
jgi:peroxidase